MNSYYIEKPYNKYFQKSRSFLFPVLGIKKHHTYYPANIYMQWDDMFSIEDKMLILTYKKTEDSAWEKYLVETLMANKMFNDYHILQDSDLIAVSFDLKIIEEDYLKVVAGRYSELSKEVKTKIRDYYGYHTAEWAYMESFLFPEPHIPHYSKLLNVEEEHIRHTGQLCDLPNLELETLKLKSYAKINDVDQINMESGQNI